MLDKDKFIKTVDSELTDVNFSAESKRNVLDSCSLRGKVVGSGSEKKDTKGAWTRTNCIYGIRQRHTTSLISRLQAFLELEITIPLKPVAAVCGLALVVSIYMFSIFSSGLKVTSEDLRKSEIQILNPNTERDK